MLSHRIWLASVCVKVQSRGRKAKAAPRPEDARERSTCASLQWALRNPDLLILGGVSIPRKMVLFINLLLLLKRKNSTFLKELTYLSKCLHGYNRSKEICQFSIFIFKRESLEEVFRGNRCHEKQKLGIVEQDS